LAKITLITKVSKSPLENSLLVYRIAFYSGLVAPQ